MSVCSRIVLLLLGALVTSVSVASPHKSQKVWEPLPSIASYRSAIAARGLLENKAEIEATRKWTDINEGAPSADADIVTIVFYYGTAAAESSSSHWLRGNSKGYPVYGAWDGGVVKSVGSSQVLWSNIAADTKLANEFFGVKWTPSLDRWLWDPYYNFALGLAHFKEDAKVAPQHVCSWYVAYRQGRGSSSVGRMAKFGGRVGGFFKNEYAGKDCRGLRGNANLECNEYVSYKGWLRGLTNIEKSRKRMAPGVYERVEQAIKASDGCWRGNGAVGEFPTIFNGGEIGRPDCQSLECLFTGEPRECSSRAQAMLKAVTDQRKAEAVALTEKLNAEAGARQAKGQVAGQTATDARRQAARKSALASGYPEDVADNQNFGPGVYGADYSDYRSSYGANREEMFLAIGKSVRESAVKKYNEWRTSKKDVATKVAKPPPSTDRPSATPSPGAGGADGSVVADPQRRRQILDSNGVVR